MPAPSAIIKEIGRQLLHLRGAPTAFALMAFTILGCEILSGISFRVQAKEAFDDFSNEWHAVAIRSSNNATAAEFWFKVFCCLRPSFGHHDRSDSSHAWCDEDAYNAWSSQRPEIPSALLNTILDNYSFISDDNAMTSFLIITLPLSFIGGLGALSIYQTFSRWRLSYQDTPLNHKSNARPKSFWLFIWSLVAACIAWIGYFSQFYTSLSFISGTTNAAGNYCHQNTPISNLTVDNSFEDLPLYFADFYAAQGAPWLLAWTTLLC